MRARVRATARARVRAWVRARARVRVRVREPRAVRQEDLLGALAQQAWSGFGSGARG